MLLLSLLLSCWEREIKWELGLRNKLFLNLEEDALNDFLSSQSRNDEPASEVELLLKTPDEDDVLERAVGAVNVEAEGDGTGVGANDTVGAAVLSNGGVVNPVFRCAFVLINSGEWGCPRTPGLEEGEDVIVGEDDGLDLLSCFLNFDSKASGLRPLLGVPEPITSVLVYGRESSVADISGDGVGVGVVDAVRGRRRRKVEAMLFWRSMCTVCP